MAVKIKKRVNGFGTTACRKMISYSLKTKIKLKLIGIVIIVTSKSTAEFSSEKLLWRNICLSSFLAMSRLLSGSPKRVSSATLLRARVLPLVFIWFGKFFSGK